MGMSLLKQERMNNADAEASVLTRKYGKDELTRMFMNRTHDAEFASIGKSVMGL